ncbi:homeobox KN domain-containing protein [Sporodiniella umbellata]|nr:homeobox KN domain-containing protein [Sporodiniella umbellata]
MSTENKEKTFTPLVLFNNNEECQTRQQQKYQIEDHRLKVEKLLEQNTRIWENIRAFSSSPETEYKENTTSDVIHQDHISPAQPFSSSYPIKKNSALVSALEHRARMKAPPPLLGFLPTTPKASTVNRHVDTTTDETKEYFESSTHFITEPSFHPTYKPHSSRKRRGNLPKEVTEFLKQWLLMHKRHPYPTEREKQQLADETGLMVSQISNWFINARRRILQPLLESENRQQMDLPSTIQYPYFPNHRHPEHHPSLQPTSDSYLAHSPPLPTPTHNYFYKDNPQLDNRRMEPNTYHHNG